MVGIFASKNVKFANRLLVDRSTRYYLVDIYLADREHSLEASVVLHSDRILLSDQH